MSKALTLSAYARFPLRFVAPFLLVPILQGCGHYYHLKVKQEMRELGPHYLYHVIVEKPAGVGWRVVSYSESPARNHVEYWNDLSPTHTMSARARQIYRDQSFKDLNELLDYVRKELPSAWRKEGEIVSFAMEIDPKISTRCVVFDGKLHSTKYGLVTTLGMICPVTLFPSPIYYMNFAEASDMPIDEARFREMALKFMRAVTRAERARRTLAD